MRGAGDPAPFSYPQPPVVLSKVPVTAGQSTGRRAHDSGTQRGLGCLQTWKGEVKTMDGSTNSVQGSMKMSADGRVAPGGAERASTVQATPGEDQSEQYSLAKILGIWALATVPMGVLSWIALPLLASDSGSDPLGFGVTRMVLLTLGLVWLFVLSMIMVHREEGSLRWATVKRRLRLNTPREPDTGRPRATLWLWVLPFLVAVAVVELVLNTPLENAWVSLFPFLAEPQGYSLDAIFESQEILARLQGAWLFFALFVIQAAFNTILGEEFLFRGVLLPKMEGVFGRWSWVANGVLFGLYHVHQPWGIPN